MGDCQIQFSEVRLRVFHPRVFGVLAHRARGVVIFSFLRRARPKQKHNTTKKMSEEAGEILVPGTGAMQPGLVHTGIA